MSVKVPTYALTEAHSHSMGVADSLVLPAGSFVKPIDQYYLPRHIKDSDAFRYLDHARFVFCYCHWGIIPIPRRIIRET